MTKNWYNQLALRGAMCRNSAFPDLNGPTTLPAWASFSDRSVSIWKMRLRKLVASRSSWVRLNFFMANLHMNYTTMVKPLPPHQLSYQVLALSGSDLSDSVCIYHHFISRTISAHRDGALAAARCSAKFARPVNDPFTAVLQAARLVEPAITFGLCGATKA